jgi:signal transduction histidine kinase
MKNLGGSGLGLRLARDTIHQFNGTLQLANHPNGGLVVTITLHLQEAPWKAPPPSFSSP